MPSGTTVERIVRAARAEIGRAHRHVLGFGENALRFFQLRHARGDLLVWSDPLQDTLADADRDVVRIKRALDRKQPVALLVFLADAVGLIGSAVKLLANLHFDQRALLLHHDDEVEAARRIPADRFCSIGQGQAILYRRMPRSLHLTSSMPSSSSA